MTPLQKKKLQPIKKVSLIYVRNLDKEDNEMLNELKSLNGFGKSNATNVMRASYKFLELLKEIKILKQGLKKLEDDNNRKDNVYRAIKTEILDIIENEIKSAKLLAKQKVNFYKSLKRTGKRIPKSLRFKSSDSYFID